MLATALMCDDAMCDDAMCGDAMCCDAMCDDAMCRGIGRCSWMGGLQVFSIGEVNNTA